MGTGKSFVDISLAVIMSLLIHENVVYMILFF